MWKNHDEAEARLHALIADFLDSRGEDAERTLDLGVVALVAEVKEQQTPEEIEDVLAQRQRPEAVYTPEAEWTHTIWYRCSDIRDWIAVGLFRTAAIVAERDLFAPDDAEESGDE